LNASPIFRKETDKMPYQYIKQKTKGAITTLTLHRPEVMNALNPDIVRELLGALDQVRSDGTIKVVVLEGAGTQPW